MDWWVKVESENLEYHRTHQGQIRADLYQGLLDASRGDGEVDLRKRGFRKVLPSSFEGGPRKMNALFQVSSATTIVACAPFDNSVHFQAVIAQVKV